MLRRKADAAVRVSPSSGEGALLRSRHIGARSDVVVVHGLLGSILSPLGNEGERKKAVVV